MRFFFIFVVLGVFGWITHVDAHQTKSSGTISILQHSDPNDEPRTGTTTTLYLNFTDTTGAFTGSQCDCVVYIAPYADLETIETTGDRFDFSSSEVIRTYNENYSLQYTFPRRGVYAIVIEGVPRVGATFEPFRIVFDLRVAHGEMLHQTMHTEILKQYPFISSNTMHILATILILLFISTVILLAKRVYIKK